jgi:uncharacterized membrane protein (DUF373 family)
MTLAPLLGFVIYFVVFCLIVWLLWYVINNVLPTEFHRVATVILVVLVVIALISFLLPYAGGPSIWRH